MTTYTAQPDEGLHLLGLAVIKQTVDDILERPHHDKRFRCCGYDEDTCAHRFLRSTAASLWSEAAGITLDRVQAEIRKRLSP